MERLEVPLNWQTESNAMRSTHDSESQLRFDCEKGNGKAGESQRIEIGRLQMIYFVRIERPPFLSFAFRLDHLFMNSRYHLSAITINCWRNMCTWGRVYMDGACDWRCLCWLFTTYFYADNQSIGPTKLQFIRKIGFCSSRQCSASLMNDFEMVVIAAMGDFLKWTWFSVRATSSEWRMRDTIAMRFIFDNSWFAGPIWVGWVHTSNLYSYT